MKGEGDVESSSCVDRVSNNRQEPHPSKGERTVKERTNNK